MAYTLNRRLAQLIDSSGQLNTGKIPNDYITSDHVADNTITSAMLHTSFTVSASNLGTTLTPTFGNITTTGYIAGPATFTIDPAAVGDNTGTVVIAGNLQVDGTTTTINSTTMEVDDLNITLASGAANAAAANGAGITVDGASATITYDGTNDAWSFNKDVGIGITPTEGKLHVKSDGAGEVELLTLENSTGTNGKTTLTFKTTSTDATKSAQIFAERINASGHTDLAFRTYNGSTTEAVRIDHDGKVAIGSTSDALDNMSGLLRILDSTGGDRTVAHFGAHNYEDTGKTFINIGTEYGDGTSRIGSFNDTGNKSVLVFDTHSATSGQFEERMRIDSSGNVLVGTTSSSGSSVKLEAHDATNPIIQVKDTTSNIICGIQAGNSAAVIRCPQDSPLVFNVGASETERMRIDSGGRVMVGTTSNSGVSNNADNLIVGDNTSSTEQGITLCSALASGIRWNDGADAGLIEYIHSSNTMTFYTSGAERLRIDSSGNMLVGATSAILSASNRGNITINGSSDSILNLGVGGSQAGYLYHNGTALNLINTKNGELKFFTNDLEKMRIDSNGIMLLGTTTRAIGHLGDVNGFGVAGNSNSVFPMVVFAEQDPTVESGSCILELSYSGDTSFSTSFYTKFTDADGTQGSISGTGAGTVGFNVSSDERIKENIVDTSSQLDKIKQVQVRDFSYIGKDVTTTGMIAQELNEIIPEVVTEGLEDATKHPWGIDYGKLTPYLIKAIQEQQTIIDDLKTRIETIEG